MVGVPTFEIIIDREYPGFNPVQFGYEDCRPGHAVGPGIRTHWLLHYVVWGKGIFCRDGVTHEVRPGISLSFHPMRRPITRRTGKRWCIFCGNWSPCCWNNAIAFPYQQKRKTVVWWHKKALCNMLKITMYNWGKVNRILLTIKKSIDIL